MKRKLKGIRRNLVVPTVLSALAFSAPRVLATDYWVKSGTTDWSNAQSYTNASGASPSQTPGSTDSVFLDENTSYEVAVPSASFTTVGGFGRICPQRGSTLAFSVATGDYTLDCPVRGMLASSVGRLVKTGSGTLVLGSTQKTDVGDDRDYWVKNLVVENGTLKLPPDVARRTYVYSAVHVATGATLELPGLSASPGSQSFIVRFDGGLTGGGTVNAPTTNSENVQLCLSSPSDTIPTVFSGALNGKLGIAVSGNVWLTGEESTFGDQAIAYENLNMLSGHRGTLGLARLGAYSAASSCGTRGGIYTGTKGGGFLYLGLGNEIVGKTIEFWVGNEGVAFFDAGARGGLTFTGSWSRRTSSAAAMSYPIVLDGTNTDECVLANNIASWTSGGKDYSFQLRKRGSGTWRLADSQTRKFKGGVFVEEGTLAFDSLTETNVLCALGYATAPTAGNIGDTEYVPYSLALGGIVDADKAILRFSGSGQGVAETRQLVLKGNGGTLAGSPVGVLGLAGVSALGTGDRTLVLDAAAGTTNYLANVSNGDGTVSVTKKGKGCWQLSGDLSFGGDLSVKDGELTVVSSVSGTSYKWFRFTIKETYSTSSRRHVGMRFLSLFDSKKAMISTGLQAIRRNPYPSTTGYYDLPGDYLKIAPGSAILGKSAKGYVQIGCDLDKLFADASSCYLGYYDAATADAYVIQHDDPASWVSIVMRLADDAPEVAYYDICRDSDCHPTYFTMEGSVDGVVWDILDESNGEKDHSTIDGRWLSDNKVYTHLTDSAHFPIRGHSEHVVSVLGSVMHVSVSGGGTLRANGANIAPIRGIKIDHRDTGGTIDGFAFASDCAVEVIGYTKPDTGEADELPVNLVNVTGTEDVSSWTLSLNGMSSRKTMVVKDGRISLVSPGFKIIFK